MTTFNDLDYLGLECLADAIAAFRNQQCTLVLIKKLAKNNNDKNQIYFHHDASILNSVFDMTFDERIESASAKKKGAVYGKAIPQAIFNEFYWVNRDGSLEKAKECKAITYHQYPETRLSGFQTEKGKIPKSLSIEYTKKIDRQPRYLAIGATSNGCAVAMMIVNPGDTFANEFKNLNGFQGSNICKYVEIEYERNDNTARLKSLLSERVANKDLTGCRFDRDMNTIPFNSTQVHGYTLEHACGIKPNSDHDGDIYGIELKAFTRKKISLITTEADGGLYKESFSGFMQKYGYLKDEDYRLTGIHRAYDLNYKSGLTLKIICFPVARGASEGARQAYDPNVPFAKQMNGLSLILEDLNGEIAASWSVEHIMNRWGAKHNEVVYVPAIVKENHICNEVQAGYKKRVVFGNQVLWCFRSTVENLLKAIHTGVIFLDPAPKFNETDVSRNKRRTQWRLNDIYKAAPTLYEKSEIVNI